MMAYIATPMQGTIRILLRPFRSLRVPSMTVIMADVMILTVCRDEIYCSVYVCSFISSSCLARVKSLHTSRGKYLLHVFFKIMIRSTGYCTTSLNMNRNIVRVGVIIVKVFLIEDAVAMVNYC